MNHKPTLLSYIICLLGTFFYLYEYAVQVSPSVMTNELMQNFNLNAAGLGILSAFFYYAYMIMQLPAGILYDRYGPRRLMSLAIAICALGVLIFSLTHSFAWAGAGRFLIGIGSAFSFSGALLLIAHWLPPQYFALMTGLVQSMSSTGAVVGQVPIAAAVAKWGWRETLLGISVVGFLLAILVWILVRDRPPTLPNPHKTVDRPSSELQRLVKVIGKAQNWYIFLYGFFIWAPIVVFAALWGVPFLAAAYGITTEVASIACAMIWVGMGISSPLLGWCSDHIQRRCLPLTVAALVGSAAAFIVIYGTHLPLAIIFIGLFLFGAASGGQPLSFGVVKDRSPLTIVGTAIGFNNMGAVAGGALLQPLAGILLSWHSGSLLQHGMHVYKLADYHFALFIVPLCYLLAAAVSAFLIQETHCKPQYLE